jgi:hypothetical protein
MDVNGMDRLDAHGAATTKTDGGVVAVIFNALGKPQRIDIRSFDPSLRFADHGDSGSAVVNNRNEIVGLLTSNFDNSGTRSFATVIDRVRDELEIEIAADPVVTSVVPNSATITTLEPVVIQGWGFQPTDDPGWQPDVQVQFGGVPAAILERSSTMV